MFLFIAIATAAPLPPQAAGHYVVGTAGPTNQDLVRSLGADEALDYSTQDVEAVYKHAPFDIVVDCVGGALLDKISKLTNSTYINTACT